MTPRRLGTRRASLPLVAADLFASIDAFRSTLDYTLQRHNVLASNLAHVDTPGWVARDLAPAQGPGGFNGVFQVALEATSQGHIAAGPLGGISDARIIDDPSGGGGNDGNFVSLDREAAKIAANHVRYDVVSTIVAAELGVFAWAANDGRG